MKKVILLVLVLSMVLSTSALASQTRTYTNSGIQPGRIVTFDYIIKDSTLEDRNYMSVSPTAQTPGKPGVVGVLYYGRADGHVATNKKAATSMPQSFKLGYQNGNGYFGQKVYLSVENSKNSTKAVRVSGRYTV